MLVVKDEGLLAELVVSLQLVDVGLVVDDVLLVLLQAVHLFLQGAGDVHRHMANLLQEHAPTGQGSWLVKSWSGVMVAYLHLSLNPGSDDVGLCSKLAPQPLIGLLSGHLLLEHLVSEGHEVLHLQVEIKGPSPEASFLTEMP